MHPLKYSRVFIGINLNPNMMKKLFVYTIVGMMGVLTSCYSFNPCVEGVGSTVEEIRDVSGFYAVSNTTSFNVHVSQADSFSVLVVAQENLMPLIETNKSGGTLIIKTREFSCIRNSSSIDVFVTLPEIEELHLTGSGRIECDGIVADELELSTTSSGDMSVDSVFCDDLYVKLTGSGDVEINKADALYSQVRLTGSGDIDLGELLTEDIEITQTSSGNIDGEVYGAETADISLTGSGRIMILGDAYDLSTNHTASGRMDLLDFEVVNARTRSTGSGDTFVNVSGLLDVTITGSGDVLYTGDPDDIISRITGSGDVRPY